MFKKDFKEATVYRLGYVNTGGYKKSSYTATGGVYFGHIKFLTIKDGVEIGAFGKEAQFNTDITADIKESDRLKIDGIDYDVKGVADFPGITFSRKMIIINKV